MADSLVSLFKATYGRLQGDDATAVVAAMLDKPLDDPMVRALAIVFYIARASPKIKASDLLDLAIGQAADQEESMVAGDPKLQEVADYLAQSLDTVPQPIPRALLQYLGVALVKKGTQPSRSKAVQFLLGKYQFA